MPMFDEWLYAKRGRRYVPVQTFEGFPCDGIWLVESRPGHHRESCVVPRWVGKVDDSVIERVSLELLRDPLIRALAAARARGCYTPNDIASEALDEVARSLPARQ